MPRSLVRGISISGFELQQFEILLLKALVCAIGELSGSLAKQFASQVKSVAIRLVAVLRGGLAYKGVCSAHQCRSTKQTQYKLNREFSRAIAHIQRGVDLHLLARNASTRLATEVRKIIISSEMMR